ncbi:hypothetical protein BBP00_00000272 [Phytophthora kernoviae]|uniref:Cytochrome P450 n=1 Tax=Phytophthora kernoviae TaxID=325452 RepID=A0A3F2S3V1_9STRA|nr:hypothetical protein BBP00_00000272 [Phytophthora kernoviae]
MLQSLLEDNLGRYAPVVPGLIAAAVAIALYCSTGTTEQPATKEEKDGKPTVKRVRYLPSKVPYLGNALELLSNSERMHDWIADHIVPFDGEPFMLSLPGKDDMMFIAKPEHIEQVLKTQFENFPKSQHIHDVFFDLLGDGIVITNGEIGFGTEMKLLEGRYQPFAEAIEESQYIVSARFKQPDPLWKIKRWLNVGSERRLREAVDVIDEHVMGIISAAIERRRLRNEEIKSGESTRPADKDIVSIILDSMETNNQVVDPVEVRNIATAALIAGRDTTADALGWLFHVLSENPSVEEKLRSELLTHIPNLTTDKEYVPTVEEFNEVPYLEATIRELLRILPAGPAIATYCARDTVFPDGTFVPKGTDIGLAFYTTGRLPSVWGEDVAAFKPERFLDPETGKAIQVSSSKFCAFSAGPRICVGRNLAFLEMKIVIANILSRFHLVPEPNQDVTYTQGITLGMKNPLMMRVEAINSQSANTEL